MLQGGGGGAGWAGKVGRKGGKEGGKEEEKFRTEQRGQKEYKNIIIWPTVHRCSDKKPINCFFTHENCFCIYL